MSTPTQRPVCDYCRDTGILAKPAIFPEPPDTPCPRGCKPNRAAIPMTEPTPSREDLEAALQFQITYLGADAEGAEVITRALANFRAQARAAGQGCDKFPVGSYVRKTKGYKFEGRVCGTFPYFTPGPNGVAVTFPKFVNVQHADGWVMHFRETELEPLPAPPTTGKEG